MGAEGAALAKRQCCCRHPCRHPCVHPCLHPCRHPCLPPSLSMLQGRQRWRQRQLAFHGEDEPGVLQPLPTTRVARDPQAVPP